jgi:hypothetical protein
VISSYRGQPVLFSFGLICFCVFVENCLNNVAFALRGYVSRFEGVCPVYLR